MGRGCNTALSLLTVVITILDIIECSEPTAMLSLIKHGDKRNGYALQLSGGQLSGYLRTLQNVPESFYKNPHIIADMDESSVPEAHNHHHPHPSPSNRHEKILTAVRFDGPPPDSEFSMDDEREDEDIEEPSPSRKQFYYDEEDAPYPKPYNRKPEKFSDYKPSYRSKKEFLKEYEPREFEISSTSRDYEREVQLPPKSYTPKEYFKKEYVVREEVTPSPRGSKVYTMRELLRELGEKEDPNQKDAEDYALKEYFEKERDQQQQPKYVRKVYQDDTTYDHPPTLISDLSQSEKAHQSSKESYRNILIRDNEDEKDGDVYLREVAPTIKEYTTTTKKPSAPVKKGPSKEEIELKSVRELLNNLIKQVEKMQRETAKIVATSSRVPYPKDDSSQPSDYAKVPSPFHKKKPRTTSSSSKKLSSSSSSSAQNSKTVYLKAHDIIKFLTGDAPPGLYPTGARMRPAYPVAPMESMVSQTKVLPPFAMYPYPLFGGPFPPMGFYPGPFK